MPFHFHIAQRLLLDIAYQVRDKLVIGQMNLTVQIPDEFVGTLSPGPDLPRRIVEGFALEEYKSKRISKAQLRRLLGLETRFELDDFLKAHRVEADTTVEDVRRDLQDLKSLGL